MNRNSPRFLRARRLASTLALCGATFSGHFALAQSATTQSGTVQSGSVQHRSLKSGSTSSGSTSSGSTSSGSMQSGSASSDSMSSGLMSSGLMRSGIAPPDAAHSNSAHAGSSHPGTAPSGQVNQIGNSGAMGESGPNSNQGAPENDLKNGISGNVPGAGAADTTYGVNSPGRLIGPAPENGQPDPRFMNERDTSSGGGHEANGKSTAAGNAQAPVSDLGNKSQPGGNPQGGTTSTLNEGLPSASKDNSGGNAGTGSGGPGGAPGTGGNGSNPGGDARPDKGASQSTQNPSDIGRETLGAAPYALIGGAVIIGAFLAAMVWARAKRKV